MHNCIAYVDICIHAYVIRMQFKYACDNNLNKIQIRVKGQNLIYFTNVKSNNYSFSSNGHNTEQRTCFADRTGDGVVFPTKWDKKCGPGEQASQAERGDGAGKWAGLGGTRSETSETSVTSETSDTSESDDPEGKYTSIIILNFIMH